MCPRIASKSDLFLFWGSKSSLGCLCGTFTNLSSLLCFSSIWCQQRWRVHSETYQRSWLTNQPLHSNGAWGALTRGTWEGDKIRSTLILDYSPSWWSSPAPDSLLPLCLLCCPSVQLLLAPPVIKHRPLTVNGNSLNTHSVAGSPNHTLYLIPIISRKSCRTGSPRHPRRSLFSILTRWSNRTLVALDHRTFNMF